MSKNFKNWELDYDYGYEDDTYRPSTKSKGRSPSKMRDEFSKKKHGKNDIQKGRANKRDQKRFEGCYM